MPVIINNETGLAEDLPQQQAMEAVQARTHGYPLNDAEGNPVVGDATNIHDLLANGHSQPSPEQLGSLLKYAKYSSPGQQAATFAEGAASEATLGLSTGLERMMGVDPEGIRDRAEINEGTSDLGKITGLTASMLTGVGEGKLLAKFGAKAVALAGLEHAAPTALQRIGASAVRQSAEMAMIQAGDEVSKAFMEDPSQTAETAIMNTGLSTILGGGMGALGSSLLVGAGKGIKDTALEGWLKAIQEKAVGTAAADTASKVAGEGGITLSPEMRAATSGEAKSQALAAELMESGSKAGAKYRESVDGLKKEASNQILSSFGRTEADLDRVASLSKYDAGEAVKKSLGEELEQAYNPIKDAYAPIEEKFSSTLLPEGTHNQIGERIGELAVEKGYNLSADSPAMKEIHRIQRDLPNLKSFEDLRKYTSVARENAMASGVPQMPRLVSQVLRQAEEDGLVHVFAKEAPEMIEAHKAARAGYKEFMSKVDDLNDRLHVGKYYGPESFIKAVKEMGPEDVIRRMSGATDAGLLKTMSELYPKTAQAVKDFHIDQALKQASARMPEGINTKTLFSTMEKWSPELKQFALSPEAAAKIEEAKGLLDRLPARINPSGTARMLDTLWKHMPGGVMSMIAMLAGHNPVMGYVLGHIGRLAGREVPDALKLSLLKFMGSEAPVSSPAFKTMVNTVHSMYEGTKAMEKASKAVFKSGSEVIPASLVPTDTQTRTLDKHIRAAQLQPENVIDATGNVGHYMPEHASAIGTTIGNAVAYLNSIKPDEQKQGMLDLPQQPSQVDKARYDRALSLIEQPMMLLQHVKDGSITPHDLATVAAVYPGLLRAMQTKTLQALTDHLSKEGTVPYTSRMGLSLLLGMPLDSTLTPQNMIANQMASQPAPAMQDGNGGAPRGSKQAFKDLPDSVKTPSQSRDSHRARKA